MTGPSPSPSGDASADRWQRLLAYRRLLVLASTVFLLDQLTKVWIGSHLPYPTYGPPGHVVLIEGFLHLVHVGNTGAAWSMFSGKSGFLALLALVTLVGIYLWRHALGLRHPGVQIGFGLLCGGIVGNLVDRVVHGHVIDFLDFHFGSYVYPTFNVADSAICIGVAIYLFQSFRQPKPA